MTRGTPPRNTVTSLTAHTGSESASPIDAFNIVRSSMCPPPSRYQPTASTAWSASISLMNPTLPMLIPSNGMSCGVAACSPRRIVPSPPTVMTRSTAANLSEAAGCSNSASSATHHVRPAAYSEAISVASLPASGMLLCPAMHMCRYNLTLHAGQREPIRSGQDRCVDEVQRQRRDDTKQ